MSAREITEGATEEALRGALRAEAAATELVLVGCTVLHHSDFTETVAPDARETEGAEEAAGTARAVAVGATTAAAAVGAGG